MIRKAPVSMIMTAPVITLKKTDTLEKAEYLFKHNHIRHIPVVDNKKIVGMLSYTDLQRLSFVNISEDEVAEADTDALVYNMFTINQIMTKNVTVISATNSIKDVAKIFTEKEFHALPVVNNNQLVGIVTTTDIIKHVLNQN